MLTATDTLYLRVVEAAGAVGLNGWFEFVPTGVTPVTVYLTSLARVKEDEGISDATYDGQLNRLIRGVSVAMQNWMKRQIVEETYTDEVHSGDGWTDTIILNNRPITSTIMMVVKLDDSAISTSTYTDDDEAGIVYYKPTSLGTSSWASGTRNYKVTYSAGYTVVPEDLAMAATDQVRHEFHQSEPAGENRLGLASTVEPAGISSGYVPHAFLPHVLEIMAPYRRII